jgi:hypothetical protein
MLVHCRAQHNTTPDACVHHGEQPAVSIMMRYSSQKRLTAACLAAKAKPSQAAADCGRPMAVVSGALLGALHVVIALRCQCQVL